MVLGCSDGANAQRPQPFAFASVGGLDDGAMVAGFAGIPLNGGAGGQPAIPGQSGSSDGGQASAAGGNSTGASGGAQDTGGSGGTPLATGGAGTDAGGAGSANASGRGGGAGSPSGAAGRGAGGIPNVGTAGTGNAGAATGGDPCAELTGKILWSQRAANSAIDGGADPIVPVETDHQIRVYFTSPAGSCEDLYGGSHGNVTLSNDQVGSFAIPATNLCFNGNLSGSLFLGPQNGITTAPLPLGGAGWQMSGICLRVVRNHWDIQFHVNGDVDETWEIWGL